AGEAGDLPHDGRSPEPPVDDPEIFHFAPEEDRIGVGEVHHLGPGRIESPHHCRSAPSTARPGPMAIMMPYSPGAGRAGGPGCSAKAFRTYKTVGDDMFPKFLSTHVVCRICSSLSPSSARTASMIFLPPGWMIQWEI